MITKRNSVVHVVAAVLVPVLEKWAPYPFAQTHPLSPGYSAIPDRSVDCETCSAGMDLCCRLGWLPAELRFDFGSQQLVLFGVRRDLSLSAAV